MADLSITAANVLWQEGPVSTDQIAGEAFIAGAMLYYKQSDGRWWKSQDDGTAAEAGADGIGMALATADAAGQRVSVARPGAIVAVGAGLAGVIYCLSGTAGSIAPSTDNASTNKVTVVALGIGSNKLLLGHMYNAGAVLA